MHHFRASAFVLLGLALGIAAPALADTVSDGSFPDVPTGSFFAEPVKNLFRQGILRGYDSGKFGPDDTVTRGQVATMIDRYDREVVGPLREQVALLRKNAGLGTCGDGIAQSIEQCDDGNTQPGDGCSPACTKEVSPECAGHKIGESFLGPDGCNRCTCTENGMACTKMFCLPKPEEKKCRSSEECGDGMACSTEYGDCQSACPPGVQACPAVCAGRCVPKKEEPTCGDGICSDGEKDFCPPCTGSGPCPMTPCRLGSCPADCDNNAAACQEAKIGFGAVPPEYLTCDDDSDCTTFMQGCPYLTCGMAVNTKGESYLQDQASHVIKTCESNGEHLACAKCMVRPASCERGICTLTAPTTEQHDLSPHR